MRSMMKFLILCFTLFRAAATQKADHETLEAARDYVRSSVNMKQNTNVAKNVILFLGDGMGISSYTAGRIRKGQLKGNSGLEEQLSWDMFPYAALVKTYSNDRIVTDSAASATSFLCGIKGNYEMFGVDTSATFADCGSSKGAEVQCQLELALEEGKSAGFVTTSRVTHATPGPLYAHTASRYWESDADVPPNATACKDTARQLIEDYPGTEIQVVLGGGRRAFLPNTTADPEYSTKTGRRKDRRNLVREWVRNMKKKGKASYVWEASGFHKIDPAETDYLLGLFEPSHMKYELIKDEGERKEPSLAEMVEKAIQILSKNENGFYLFVESSNVDVAHHFNLAKHAIHAVLSMDEAVNKAVEMTNEDDTLIVVTADHSHPLNIGGYPYRGMDLLGFAEDPSDIDKMPYTILSYGNGIGFNSSYPMGRQNLTDVDTTTHDYRPQTAVPLSWETHSGEDVSIFANGPMAHLFHGTIQNHYIPHVMGYAACIGENKEHCSKKKKLKQRGPYRKSGARKHSLTFLTALYSSFVICLNTLV